MANGILALAFPNPGTDTIAYTVPAGMCASVAVNVCNTGIATNIRIAVRRASDTSFIEYDVPLGGASSGANSLYARAIVLDAGQQLIVRSSGAGTHFTVTGYEQPSSMIAVDM